MPAQYLLMYAAFFGASYFGFCLILLWSTYHRYFFKILPVLIGYSVLNGYLLFILKFSGLFVWHVGLCSLLFIIRGYRYWRASKRMSAYFRGGMVDSNLLRLSAASTMGHFVSSACVYLVTVSVSFLFFYNR